MDRHIEHPIIQRLADRLRAPLPGREAHLRMASKDRSIRYGFKIPDNPRISAVLLLLDFQEGDLVLPLIQRPSYPGVHSGQMAFPGGKRETQDQDLTDTALREAREEINAQVSREAVIGQLSNLYIPLSNSLVTPVVAISERVQQFVPEPLEVAKVVQASMRRLSDPSSVAETTIAIGNGLRIKAPYFDVDGHIVWGATAMILSELLHLLEEIR